MRAARYTRLGGPEVIELVDLPEPEPGPGEIRVRVAVSGVNPTDWKTRGGVTGGPPPPGGQVPNQDGAGTIDRVGSGVDPARVGERVWLWEAAWQRPGGTAQEFVVLPERQAVALPAAASFDLGASLGIPALTAHRCLTSYRGPGAGDTLAPGTLKGRTVLVAGGAGAVGHAAIELARWAGARVVTTVSSTGKADLARAAGAHAVVNYRAGDAVEAVRGAAPDGVDLVVELAPATNAALDLAVLAPNGTIACYAAESAAPGYGYGRELMVRNIAVQWILVYTVPAGAKAAAVRDVAAAVADGALRVGPEAGLPLHRYPLERTADAHRAVESGAVGKVLVDIG